MAILRPSGHIIFKGAHYYFLNFKWIKGLNYRLELFKLERSVIGISLRYIINYLERLFDSKLLNKVK